MASLSEFDESTITEIEEFVRNVFSQDMIVGSVSIEKYLGIFSKKQKDIIVMSGEKKILKQISKVCSQLYDGSSRVTILLTLPKVLNFRDGYLIFYSLSILQIQWYLCDQLGNVIVESLLITSSLRKDSDKNK